VLESRLRLKDKTAELDLEGAEDLMVKMYHWDQKAMLEAQD